MLACIICSRKDSPPYSLKLLEAYLRDANIDYHISYDKTNPFEGYKEGVEKLCLTNDNDQVILCHDDIEILSTAESLKFWVNKYLTIKNIGFVGVAGTTYFDVDGMWWDLKKRQSGLHRGFVFQGLNQLEMTPNYFGKFGERCCVMDGCFLATRLSTLKSIAMKQPSYLTGFDYYDVYMTATSYLSGMDNYAIPVIIKHQSNGEMRQSWYTSKDNFIREHRRDIPMRSR